MTAWARVVPLVETQLQHAIIIPWSYIECPESQVEKFGIKVFQYESMASHIVSVLLERIIGVFEKKRD